MKKKIFWNMVLLSVVSILIMGIMTTVFHFQNTYQDMVAAVRADTRMFSEILNLNGYQFLGSLKNISNSVRLTLIDTDGVVLYDSQEKPADMENHADRPEVIAAIKNGVGEDERFSKTIADNSFYYAVRLADGKVIRASKEVGTFWNSVVSTIPLMIITGLIILIVALILANQQTKKIIEPLNKLDLENPLSNDAYDELAPLIERIAQQQTQIKTSMEDIRSKQKEFNSVVNNMSEGLIILNKNANILTINQSVQKIFEIEPGNYFGKKIYTLFRSAVIQNAIEKAMNGTPNETVIDAHGRHYQMLVNPIMDNGNLKGIVLFILDITDKINAEDQRREFTANVSHELKTPLTSIRGYAEIIKEGIAKTEDIPEFSTRIYNEADRMLTMVNDIMSLSHMDEGSANIVFEPIDLKEIANEVAERFVPIAAKNNISISVQGDSAIVQGNRRLLDEMFFNLIENAIKYNTADGRVDISLQSTEESVIVKVADTGIGINREDQSHVFERFYRADKSHCRDSGGTGLGLSIVKHSAMVHNAKVELSSQINSGTTVIITFPL